MFDTLAPLLAEQPWAINRAVLDALINTRIDSITPEAVTPTPMRAASRGRGVAVLSVRGPISQHASGGLFEMLFGGGATVDQITADFRDALADDSVRGIVFDIDSPGGSAYGIPELAAEIYRARGRKPVVALANSIAASAAYWPFAAADEFYVTPSGVVGSIGVYGVHLDFSVAAEKEGIKPTIFSAGKFKTEGHELEPLTDEAKQAAQHRIDSYYDLFVRDVAKFRGATEAQVRSGYGEGRPLVAKDAVSANLVDGIRTYDQVLARIGTAPTSARGEEAAASLPLLEQLESAASANSEAATRLKRRSDFRAGEGRTLGDSTLAAAEAWLTANEALAHEVRQVLAEHAEPDPDAQQRQDRFRGDRWRLQAERLEADLERLKVSA